MPYVVITGYFVPNRNLNIHQLKYSVVVEDPTNQFIPHLEKITIPLKANAVDWEEAEARIPWGTKHQSNQVGRHACWESSLASPVEVLNEAEKCGFVAVMMASTNGGRTTKWTLQKKEKDLHL